MCSIQHYGKHSLPSQSTKWAHQLVSRRGEAWEAEAFTHSSDSSAGRQVMLLLLICCKHRLNMRILPLETSCWIMTQRDTPLHSVHDGNLPLFGRTSKQNRTSVLLQSEEETRRLGFSDIMTHKSARSPEVILQASCSSSESCVNHPRVVAAIQAGTGRKQSSVPNFLTPTQTHNRLRRPGAGPTGPRAAWKEALTCCAHLSWKNLFIALCGVSKMRSRAN